MRIRTKQEQIRTVADKWKHSYQGRQEKFEFDVESIGFKLSQLPPNATEAQIGAIVGLSSWVMRDWLCNTCSECGVDMPLTAELQADSDECEGVRMCLACLQKAVVLCQY